MLMGLCVRLRRYCNGHGFHLRALIYPQRQVLLVLELILSRLVVVG